MLLERDQLRSFRQSNEEKIMRGNNMSVVSPVKIGDTGKARMELIFN